MFDQLTVRKQLKADGIFRRQSLRHADLASDGNAVDAIIQALDDNSLIPAAAKSTEGAGSYASAKELARSLADMLAAANRKKRYSVELILPISYRHVDDLRDIFDRTEAIVRQIAGAIPGGVPNVVSDHHSGANGQRRHIPGAKNREITRWRIERLEAGQEIFTAQGQWITHPALLTPVSQRNDNRSSACGL